MFWTLNNFLLGDREFAPLLVHMDICKGISNTFDKIKTKSDELMAEMTWTINYLLDYSEECVVQVWHQIPSLIQRLTLELDFEGDRLVQSPVNRPVIRIIGNLLTIPSIP